MKVVSYSESGYSFTARYVVELSEEEAQRVMGHEGMSAIKKAESHNRLGMEIDLTQRFRDLDAKARKANQLDSLVRSIAESKTLVFPEEPAQP